MKYLQKFNEELKSSVFKSAARKLRKISKDQPVLAKAIKAEDRASNLEEYSKRVENRENLQKWKKNVEDFSKHGEFNIEVSRPGTPSIRPKIFTFYLDLVSDVESLIDSWEDEDQDNREITFGFCAGFIPKSEEDIQEFLQNFNNEFYNGFFWGMWIYITYRVLQSEVSFKGIYIGDYDMSPKFQIADRKTAVSLKRLLTNIFDPTFEYPSGYTDITNMYDKIERSTIQDLEIGINFNIDMQRIKNDIQSLPIMDFYKKN